MFVLLLGTALKHADTELKHAGTELKHVELKHLENASFS